MAKEKIEDKIRYFYIVKKIDKKEDSVNYPGWIFEVNEQKGQVTNLSGPEGFVRQSDFHLTRESRYNVGSEYSIEEIEKSKALYIRAEQDESGKNWQNLIMKISGIVKEGLGGRA